MDPGLGAMGLHGFAEDVNFAALASAPPPPPPPPSSAPSCASAPPPQLSGPPPMHSISGPPPQHSMTGPPPQHTMTGPPPAHSVAGPPPHSMSGPPPPHSISGPPPLHSLSGPPLSHSASAPPPHSVSGPPPHSVSGPPPSHSVSGPSPSHSVSGPPPPLSGPLPPPPPPPVPPSETHENNNFRRANQNYYNKNKMNPKKQVVTQKCEICNIELVGQVVIDAHMNGSKHAKKLKAKELLNNLIDAGQVKVENDKNNAGIFKCEICNVVLNSSQQLDVHNAGAKHKAKVSESGTPQVEQNTSAPTWIDPSTNGSNDSKGNAPKPEKPKSMIANPLDLVCTTCNITVNSPQQLEQHLNSKKHQDRESGRSSHRPTPYSRGGRGGRGGLGSQGRGGKSVPAKFTSLSNSFKSAGYSNSFIKPEGGVSMPANCGTNRGQSHAGPSQYNSTKPSNYGNNFKNRGNFGSLTPYVNTDKGRGGYNGRGGGVASGGNWASPAGAPYGAPQGYSGYEYDQYNYGYGYENSESYGGYGMTQSGPPPTY